MPSAWDAGAGSSSALEMGQAATDAENSATQAATSATQAADSASAAANSASQAAQSATDATNNGATQVSLATTQADNAATSASNAATSESNAATSASQAATSATAASNSATDASNSATAAQNAASSIGFKNVIFLTAANSPYTVTASQEGNLFSIDTSGGSVMITLPQISALTLPSSFGFKKSTTDGNVVTINTSGTDSFDSGTSKIINSGGTGTTLIPESTTNPDKYIASDWGALGGDQKRQQFASGTDFTGGTTTQLTLTVSPIATSANSLDVYFDSAFQQFSEWSYNPAAGVITFNSAIPVGVSKIECEWAVPLVVGTPSDGTVSTPKLADKAVTQGKIGDKAVGTEQIGDGAVGSGQLANGAVGKTQLDAATNKLTAKAWAATTSTGGFIGQDGFSAVTRLAAGQYRFTFAIPMVDVNYVPLITDIANTTQTGVHSQPMNITTTTFDVYHYENNGTLTDCQLFVVVFGN